MMSAKIIIDLIDYELSTRGVEETVWRKIMIPLVEHLKDDLSIQDVYNQKIHALRMELATGERSWLDMIDVTSRPESGIEYWTARCHEADCYWSKTRLGDEGHEDVIRLLDCHMTDEHHIAIIFPSWAFFAPDRWRPAR